MADGDEQVLDERIRRAKKELERMIDLSPRGMILAERDGRVLRANAGLLSLLGRTSFTEVLGERCWDLFRGAGDPVCPLEAFFREPGLGVDGAFVKEARARIRGMETSTLRFTVVGSHGDAERYVILVDDVTEEKKESVRQEKRGKIEAAEALTGALCHTLNQPLAVILGRAQLLLFSIEKEGVKTEALRTGLQEIADLTRHVAGILRKANSFKDFVTTDYVDGVGILDLERSTSDAENKEDGTDPGTDKA